MYYFTLDEAEAQTLRECLVVAQQQAMLALDKGRTAALEDNFKRIDDLRQSVQAVIDVQK